MDHISYFVATDDKYKKIRGYDRFLDEKLVKLTKDADIMRFLRETNKSLSMVKDLPHEIIILQLETYKRVYEQYKGELGWRERGIFKKGIKDLEAILKYRMQQEKILHH